MSERSVSLNLRARHTGCVRVPEGEIAMRGRRLEAGAAFQPRQLRARSGRPRHAQRRGTAAHLHHHGVTARFPNHQHPLSITAARTHTSCQMSSLLMSSDSQFVLWNHEIGLNKGSSKPTAADSGVGTHRMSVGNCRVADDRRRAIVLADDAGCCVCRTR